MSQNYRSAIEALREVRRIAALKLLELKSTLPGDQDEAILEDAARTAEECADRIKEIL